MRAVEAVPKGLEACMARETLEKRRREYAYEDEQGENPGMRLLREMLEVAVITLLLFVVVRGVMQNFRVDGPSMEPTLQNHEYIIVNKLQYVVSSPQRGDIIVFKWPEDTSQDFVNGERQRTGDRRRRQSQRAICKRSDQSLSTKDMDAWPQPVFRDGRQPRR
jgi:hypothetical protein